MGEARILAFDFLIWFGWLGLFALAQRRFCRKYPGMRSMCRGIFLATVAVAVLPGLWLLLAKPGGSPHMMTMLNKCFGLGVYAQTSLRAALMLKWIAWTGFDRGMTLTVSPLTAMRNERILLASLLMLTQAVGKRNADQPAARPPDG